MAALGGGPRRLLTRGTLCPVNLRSGFKQAKASCQEKEIPPEGAGEEGVQEGVGARVNRVEENQQEFGVRDGDERELEGGRGGEEGDGSHADEVGEDEHGHTRGHQGVGVGRR